MTAPGAALRWARTIARGPARFWDYVEDFLAYPGWLEVLAGVGGGVGYTLVTMFASVPVSDRPGLALATALVPGFWEVAGVLLASWHSWALFRSSIRARYWAVGASAAFWCNFTYGIAATCVVDGRPLPITIVPCAILSLILLVLTWRLAKGYG